ncbi:Aste57867_12045 [Aphanomyces stellatus]|uniref:Aste57867_12045 protein n=1 Tax=Aphanomyces stellatus TaxID=120398 RepID=A0A485KVR5_9STRA|nr:hypothetical protein As57867_012000 [Aphanomyces stellatus]VFT88900.1 Aste57867_12045 [Aphanomyces stellatus]
MHVTSALDATTGGGGEAMEMTIYHAPRTAHRTRVFQCNPQGKKMPLLEAVGGAMTSTEMVTAPWQRNETQGNTPHRDCLASQRLGPSSFLWSWQITLSGPLICTVQRLRPRGLKPFGPLMDATYNKEAARQADFVAATTAHMHRAIDRLVKATSGCYPHASTSSSLTPWTCRIVDIGASHGRNSLALLDVVRRLHLPLNDEPASQRCVPPAEYMVFHNDPARQRLCSAAGHAPHPVVVLEHVPAFLLGRHLEKFLRLSGPIRLDPSPAGSDPQHDLTHFLRLRAEELVDDGALCCIVVGTYADGRLDFHGEPFVGAFDDLVAMGPLSDATRRNMCVPYYPRNIGQVTCAVAAVSELHLHEIDAVRGGRRGFFLSALKPCMSEQERANPALSTALMAC